MLKSTRHAYTMKIAAFIFSLILLSNLNLAQELNLKHTGGPMGGIVGDIGITSNGDIYAGVYSIFIPYSGLYKSTDNGDSWNKIETQFDDFQVYGIYITAENHIWVGTNFQGRIYRSTDNGQTWENKRNGYNTGECWAFGQSNDGVLFAGDGQYINLYKSTDYGDNWEFSINLRPLVFATDSNNIVYAGTHDGLFGTTDNGLTWGQNNFLANIPVASILIDSNNNIFCGTGYYNNGNGVFYSTDAGQNWAQLGLAGKVVLSLAFDSQGNLYAGTLQDGLYKTSDMGLTWNQYQEGLYRKQVFRLKINKNDEIFIGSENEGVFRSTSNSNSFEQIGLPLSNLKNISFSGDSLIFASTPSGIQKFNRFTGEWTNLGLHDVFAVDLTPDGTMYAATFAEGLFKSTDFGQNWSLTNLNADSNMSVYNVLALNADTVFAATEFNLRKSTDGGISWVVLPLKTSFFSRGMYLNKNDLWVTGYGASSYVLYKSSDYHTFDSTFSGLNWSENNCISALENGVIFITDRFNGTFRSINNGVNWQQILPKHFVWTIYSDASGLVLGGARDSLWHSSDFGDTWQDLYIPLKEGNNVTEIKAAGDTRLYLGTYSEGLYELDIITKVNEESIYSDNYFLSQNFPNPFNPTTKIKYSTPKTDLVQIKIFDILGNEIKTLLNEYKLVGEHEIEFDARLTTNPVNSLPSGVYFYRIVSGSYSETKKMLLLK